MPLKISPVFKKNKKHFKQDKRFIINQGGSSSTKTYSILQLLVLIIQKYDLHIDVVGLSVPHLKAGVLNDCPAVMEDMGLNFHNYYSISEKELKLKGRIRFLSIDKIGKAHGGRRDILFLNEANHLSWSIAEQLILRTRKTVFIDFNPTSKFWAHTEIKEKHPEKTVLIKSNYKDNPFLEQEIVEFIESKKGNNNFWRVYGLGEIGKAEGLVFENFKQETFDKEQFEQYRHGIDWGFSNDPFAYVRCAIHNNKLYICDEVYQRGLLNKQSSEIVKEYIKSDAVFCDSSEPKSVTEYKSYGIDARSVKKGQGSVSSGIKFMQSFDEVVIHTDCPHVYDEFCNYDWRKDKNGEALPEPVDAFNHAIDAIRYAIERDMPKGGIKKLALGGQKSYNWANLK